MSKSANKKNLISMANLSTSDLIELIQLAQELKSDPVSKSNALKNMDIALIFAKPSLRTRISFEVGINQLGGHPITIKMDEISIGEREDVKDIANVLSRYVKAIVIRTFKQEQIELLGKHASVPVINGLSNDEHPCQVIADLLTIKEIFNSFSGLKIAFIGDGNNIANSLLLCAALADMNIAIGCPNTHKPKTKYIEQAKKINPKIDINITDNPIDAAKDAHVLYTDTWISMGQESEQKNRKQSFANYQINTNLLKLADKNAIVLHCLPAHKGEEITEDVFEKFSNIIYNQAENRLHAEKAILLKLISE